MAAGQTARAVDILRSAHGRFPSHRDTLFGLATILRDAGQIDAAVEYATKLLAIVPSDQEGRGLLAELEAARGR